MQGYGVYLHIPFCRQKCHYCDFPSVAGCDDRMEDYARALCMEILSRAEELRTAGEAVSVYIGGGTPTALPTLLLSRIIQTVHGALPLAKDVEFTVEVNPGTVDLAMLTALYTLGVTRLSIGAQSFNDRLLQTLGRIHTARDIRDAVRWARAAGFTNVSIDLMYGLPGQTPEDVRRSLNEAMDLAVTHISIYGLILEEGTPFSAMHAAGALTLPDEEAEEAMYDYLTERLPAYGFLRYEIANFGRPGFYSRHNQLYWTDVPYVGFGAAAHSYWNDRRTENSCDIEAYIAAVREGRSPAREEAPATRRIRTEEFCFLALRTARGISRAAFYEKFGVSLESVYAAVIENLCKQGLLETDEHFVRLTRQGMKLGNVAFRAFLLDEDDAAGTPSPDANA